MGRIYPESKVELKGWIAKRYDNIMNMLSLGKYSHFIESAIAKMNIQAGENILDLGCGTGRNACLMRNYVKETGSIVGLDISSEMAENFKNNCSVYDNISFKEQRIDVPFDFGKKFDKALISFVIHGFPHEVRKQVIQNVNNQLKPGGAFYILDFGEFKLQDMPFYYRIPFQKVECKYAFDFIERDWKNILRDYGFNKFTEDFWMKKYARLLGAIKEG